MAEIAFNEAYENLTEAQKREFDGVMGMGGFNERYQKNPESQLVTSDPDYATFEPIAKAYKDSETLNKGSSLNPLNWNLFSSADASIVEPTYGLQTNTMGGMTLNEDGTISYNTETPQNLPYSPIMDAVRANQDFMSQFETPQAANRYSGMGQVGPVKSDMIDIESLQDPFTNNISQSSFFDANPRSIAAQKEKAAFQELMSRMPGSVLEQSNYVEQPEGLDALFQNFNIDPFNLGSTLKSKAKTGWENVKGGIKSLFDKTMMGRVLGAIGNQFQDRTLGTSHVVDEFGNIHNAAALNQMNALGGGYTDAARSARRARARLNNVLARKAAGKKYGNLDKLLEISRLQQELDNAGYTGTPGGNTGSGAFAKFDNTSKNYGPHTKGGGKTTSGGGNWGMGAGAQFRKDGGRIGYGNGGLASLFTRRR